MLTVPVYELDTLHQVDCTTTVFTKSRQHVCHVRRKIQMSDVGFVKIIIIYASWQT